MHINPQDGVALLTESVAYLWSKAGGWTAVLHPGLISHGDICGRCSVALVSHDGSLSVYQWGVGGVKCLGRAPGASDGRHDAAAVVCGSLTDECAFVLLTPEREEGGGSVSVSLTRWSAREASEEEGETNSRSKPTEVGRNLFLLSHTKQGILFVAVTAMLSKPRPPILPSRRYRTLISAPQI